MDVVEIVKTGEHFRMLYDLKGRYMPVRIDSKEATFKLCKFKNKVLGAKRFPTSLPTTEEPSASHIQTSRRTIPSR